MRKRIFEIIDTSNGVGVWHNIYDYIMIVVIVISLVPLAFKATPPVFVDMDYIAAAIFCADYLLRLMTADYKFGKKSVSSFIRYPFSPMAIIDLLSILPSFTALNAGFRLFRLLRMMRALRVFRVFKMMRYSKSINIVVTVLKKQKTALIAVGTLAVGYILVSALIMFNVEPDSFKTFFDAVYWATISLTTVGYGDIYPVTVIGRAIAMISAILGIAVIALPSGVITAGYMTEIKAMNGRNGKNREPDDSDDEDGQV